MTTIVSSIVTDVFNVPSGGQSATGSTSAITYAGTTGADWLPIDSTRTITAPADTTIAINTSGVPLELISETTPSTLTLEYSALSGTAYNLSALISVSLKGVDFVSEPSTPSATLTFVNSAAQTGIITISNLVTGTNTFNISAMVPSISLASVATITFGFSLGDSSSIDTIIHINSTSAVYTATTTTVTDSFNVGAQTANNGATSTLLYASVPGNWTPIYSTRTITAATGGSNTISIDDPTAELLQAIDAATSSVTQILEYSATAGNEYNLSAITSIALNGVDYGSGATTTATCTLTLTDTSSVTGTYEINPLYNGTNTFTIAGLTGSPNLDSIASVKFTFVFPSGFGVVPNFTVANISTSTLLPPVTATISDPFNTPSDAQTADDGGSSTLTYAEADGDWTPTGSSRTLNSGTGSEIAINTDDVAGLRFTLGVNEGVVTQSIVYTAPTNTQYNITALKVVTINGTNYGTIVGPITVTFSVMSTNGGVSSETTTLVDGGTTDLLISNLSGTAQLGFINTITFSFQFPNQTSVITSGTVANINYSTVLPCVARDTMILMADGTEKPIQYIERGDLVQQGNGEIARVARLVYGDMPGITPVSIIKIKRDAFAFNKPSQDLIMSSGHPILYNGNRRRAKMFKNLDGVTYYSSAKTRAQNVLPENDDGTYSLFNIQFEHDGFFVANGLVVDSLPAVSSYMPLPRNLYFNPELYNQLPSTRIPKLVKTPIV